MNTIALSFAYDQDALVRERNLALVRGQDRYAIPVEPVYGPVHQFLGRYGPHYPFTMLDLLHAAAVKMLGWPNATPRQKTLLAAGGLYLALDPQHPDLAVRTMFGDFTSGFSHQFGVALATMSMSEAFAIPWDSLVPIPVGKGRTLDYEAPIPDGSGWLRLEAKGCTSSSSRTSARHSAYAKKRSGSGGTNSPRRTFAMPTAMIGVITQAARSGNESGKIEIIDPELDRDPDARRQRNQLAGRYLHYAGVAAFAGLRQVAQEFRKRAERLARDRLGDDMFAVRGIDVADGAVFECYQQSFVGLQWRLGESRDPDQDVWFYHGFDRDLLEAILVREEFPPVRPYYRRDVLRDRDAVESILPDGSYFGIGIGPRKDMLRVDKRAPEWPDLAILSLRSRNITS